MRIGGFASGLQQGYTVLPGSDAARDMVRTSVNVLGNCLATAVIARWEGCLAVPAR